jgi:hypothetical protein
VTVHADGGQLRGEVKVERAEVLDQLRNEAPALLRQLSSGGVQVRRLEMTLDNTAADGHREGAADGRGQNHQQQPHQPWGRHQRGLPGDDTPEPFPAAAGAVEEDQGFLNVWM